MMFPITAYIEAALGLARYNKLLFGTLFALELGWVGSKAGLRLARGIGKRQPRGG